MNAQILLTNNQFDLLAKTAVVKIALQDSLQECKEELRECNRMVSNLELKNTGTELALSRSGQIADNYRLTHAMLQQKYDKIKRWLTFAKKVIVVCVAVIVGETIILYYIVTH